MSGLVHIKNKITNWLQRRNVSAVFALIFILGVVIRLGILIEKGPAHGTGYDDFAYFNSGLHLFETGEITIRGSLTAQITPGMPVIIAAFIMIFGTGTGAWLALKLFWITLAMLGVLLLYRTVRLFAADFFACLSAAFLSLGIDFCYLDNSLMTETPFMFCFIAIIYCTIKLGYNHQSLRYFFCLFIAFFAALTLRPVIAFLPVVIIGYLIIKKYPWRRLAMQTGAAAAVIIIIFILPWSIRNYRLFGEFIPLSYGSGNPVLQGTYQGYGFPEDSDLDIQGDVYEKLSPQFKQELEGRGNPHMTKYRSMQVDGIVAKYRMEQWLKTNPVSMLVSYIIIKPSKMLFSSFDPNAWFVGGRPMRINNVLRGLDFSLMLIGIFGMLKRRKHRKEMGFILLIYVIWLGINSYALAMARYAQAAYFLRFILLGWGLYQFWLWIQPRLLPPALRATSLEEGGKISPPPRGGCHEVTGGATKRLQILDFTWY